MSELSQSREKLVQALMVLARQGITSTPIEKRVIPAVLQSFKIPERLRTHKAEMEVLAQHFEDMRHSKKNYAPFEEAKYLRDFLDAYDAYEQAVSAQQKSMPNMMSP